MKMSRAQLSVALVLLGLAASAMATGSGSGSGESHEQKKRRERCGGLVEEPPVTVGETEAPTTEAAPPPGFCVCPSTDSDSTGPTEPSGEDFHSNCPLVKAFYNMSLVLTVEQRIIFEAWIQEIENTVLVNVSLTADQKIVLISVSLRAFLEINVDIYQKISYYQIADWGYVIDFLYVSISIQIEITQSIVIVDASGECGLTKAIKEAGNKGSPSDKAACDSLNVEIKAVLVDVTLTYEAKLAVVFELIQSFCQQHPDKVDFLLSIEIEGFGSLHSFVLVAQTYWRISQLHVVLSGSTIDDCPLLEGLQAAYENTSFTVEQRGQIYQIIQKLTVAFQVNVTISSRLKVCSAEFYQFFKLESWLIQLLETITISEWGSVYDLIFCSGVCTNNGCGNIDVPTTTTPVATTPAVTSTVATSQAPADCGTVATLIVITASNTTILTDSITAGIANWDATTKNGFTSTFNKIRRDIWNHSLYPTPASKLAQLNIDCAAYNSNNAAKRAQFYAIVIASWGTIGDFVSCTA